MVTGVSLTHYNLGPSLEVNDFFPAAYGQMFGEGFGNANDFVGPQNSSNNDVRDPGDPGGDSNFTDLPPDASNDLGEPDLNDTIGGQDMSNPNMAAQMTNPNATTSEDIAEPTDLASFVTADLEPLSAILLGVSIVVALMLGQRAFFKFGRW